MNPDRHFTQKATEVTGYFTIAWPTRGLGFPRPQLARFGPITRIDCSAIPERLGASAPAGSSGSSKARPTKSADSSLARPAGLRALRDRGGAYRSRFHSGRPATLG